MAIITRLPFASTTSLKTADLRSMFQLCEEVRKIGGAFKGRAEHYLRGISRLIGAQVGLFSQLEGYLPGSNWHIEPILDFGWNHDADRKLFMSFFDGDQMSDPLTPRCIYLLDSVATASRRCLVEDALWNKSPNVNELRRPAHLDDCIYSHYHLRKAGFAMGMAFHRPRGSRRFGPRERLIVHVMHEFNPLYDRDYVSQSMTSEMPMRMQQVLDLLKAGFSEKEAADYLEISHHTVHVHVKNLYKHFAVCSRGELLSLWVMQKTNFPKKAGPVERTSNEYQEPEA